MAPDLTTLIGPLLGAWRGIHDAVVADPVFRAERAVVLAAHAGKRPRGEFDLLALLDPPARVVDAAGHNRPVYRRLVQHAAILSLIAREEAEANRAALDAVSFEAADTLLPLLDDADLLTAARGHDAVVAGWTAVVLADVHRAGAGTIGSHLCVDRMAERLTRSQQPAGALLRATASDNPETRWFHELLLLHAAGHLAADHDDIPALLARAADFHAAETQPDHATGQPWWLAALSTTPAGKTLAMEILHTTTTQPHGGIAITLLADALIQLRAHDA